MEEDYKQDVSSGFSDDSDLRLEKESQGAETAAKSRLQELTEKATRSHATERAKRDLAKKEFQSLKRIMNDQQLKTYLVKNDLRKNQEFRKHAIEFEVNRAQIQATNVHIAQQMIELDDDAMYNFKNRMDKAKYNSKMNTSMAVAD